MEYESWRKRSYISVQELTNSQVHPKESMQNTPKEGKILRTTDANQCSGPTLTLNGACEEETHSSLAEALKSELTLKQLPTSQRVNENLHTKLNHADHLL